MFALVQFERGDVMDIGSGIPPDGSAMCFRFAQEPFIDPKELRSIFAHTQGIVLSQVSALSGLQPTTIQNWIKRGLVPSPVRKRYDERTVSRILIVGLLHNCLPLGQVAFLLACINGDTETREDDLVPEEDLYQLLYQSIMMMEASEISVSFSDSLDMQNRLFHMLPIQHLDNAVKRRVVSVLVVMLIAYISAEQQRRALLAIEQLRAEYADVSSSFMQKEACARPHAMQQASRR